VSTHTRTEWRLHVASVTKVHATSVGALIGAVLQIDDALSRAQLLLTEVALIRVRGLGSQGMGRAILGAGSRCDPAP